MKQRGDLLVLEFRCVLASCLISKLTPADIGTHDSIVKHDFLKFPVDGEAKEVF